MADFTVFETNVEVSLQEVVLIFGCETWVIKEFTKRKLTTIHRATERYMLGLTSRIEDVRELTNVDMTNRTMF